MEKTIGERFREIRNGLMFSQNGFASKLNLFNDKIKDIELNISKPSIKVMQELHKLGGNIEYLIVGTGTPLRVPQGKLKLASEILAEKRVIKFPIHFIDPATLYPQPSTLEQTGESITIKAARALVESLRGAALERYPFRLSYTFISRWADRVLDLLGGDE